MTPATATERQRSGHDLLCDYEPGRATLLAYPSGTILARDVHAKVDAAPGELPASARRALAQVDADGIDEPLLVGVFGFDPDTDNHLTIRRAVERGGPLQLWEDDAIPVARAGAPRVTARPSDRAYERAVQSAVSALRRGGLRKVVLARELDIGGLDGIDVSAVVGNLAVRDPLAFVFAVDMPSPDEHPRTFVGASPELLLRRRGREVRTTPLAGSAPRHPDPREDARRAAALLRSPKQRDEHAAVVDLVAERLRPWCDVLEVPAGPELVRTDVMWHLATRVRGRVAEAGTCSLTLALALHPTPAVCGAPPTVARDLIATLEPFRRGFYGGAVGWQDRHGDGEWVLAIRCGEVHGDRLRLWAGAGIVAQSTPDDELREVQAKSRTMLDAVGLEAVT